MRLAYMKGKRNTHCVRHSYPAWPRILRRLKHRKPIRNEQDTRQKRVAPSERRRQFDMFLQGREPASRCTLDVEKANC